MKFKKSLKNVFKNDISTGFSISLLILGLIKIFITKDFNNGVYLVISSIVLLIIYSLIRKK